MSKKKGKKSRIYDEERRLRVLTNRVNKKKKLKGKNHYETKILNGACLHNIINKKGKVKPTLFSSDNGWKVCRICGHYVKPTTYGKETVKDKIKGAVEIVDNMKFISVAIDAGEGMQRYASDLGSMLAVLSTNYRKVAKIAEKRDTIKNKKQKTRSNDSLGSWR